MKLMGIFERVRDCALWLAAALVIAWRFMRRRLGLSALAPYSSPRMHRIRRLASASAWGESSGSRHPLTKPDWIKSAVLQLAHDLPHAGCRSLAHSFNLAHSASNQTVSKTWVANLLIARAAALALARRRSKHGWRSSRSGEPIQRVWGVDLTGLPLKSGEIVDVWGVIDHGSRAVLHLEPLAKFNSLILLGKLFVAFGEFGFPKAIRSDNASVFKTLPMRTVLKLLGMGQQFTEPHSPWQNGRIERFWRTCKETLGTRPIRFRQGLRVIQEQMCFASFEAMRCMLPEFRDFYNHSRPHQALRASTPTLVWNAQVAKRREKINKKPLLAAQAPPARDRTH